AQQSLRAGRDPSTASARPRVVEKPAAGTGRFGQVFGRFGVHLAVILLMAIWLIPSIGLLVNSFRPAQAVASTGWWTGLLPPKDLSFDSYAAVLAEQGIGAAFVNSLFITIPATVIPIFVAAFAAYAFSWMT